MRLKNNFYRIQVFEKANEILSDLGIVTETGLHYKPLNKMIRSEKMARPFTGSFLASGFHLIILKHPIIIWKCPVRNRVDGIGQKIMERFYLPAKIVQRKKYFVVYMKAGDKIADFCACAMPVRLCSNLKILASKEISLIRLRV